MANSSISDIELFIEKNGFSLDEDITINVKFSIQGMIRNVFTEKNWTKAYNKNDNTFKLKYGIKLFSGGFRKSFLTVSQLAYINNMK